MAKQYNNNSNYNNRAEPTIAAKTAAIQSIQKISLGLPDAAQNAMQAAGFSPDQSNQIIGMCVALGAKPSIMANPMNLKAVKQAWEYMSQYNMVPGHHFYGVVYKSQVSEYDEDGKKVEAGWLPQLSIQLYYGTLQANVEEYGRRNNDHYRLVTQQVMQEDKRREIIDFILGDKNPVHDKHNRVCMAKYVPRGENPDFTEWQYGIYLAKGVGAEDGSVKKYGKAESSDFRTGAEIAKTRAIRLACRAVTANLYRVSGADAFSQYKEIVEDRSKRLMTAVASGTDIDTAFDMLSDDTGTSAESPKQATAIYANAVHMDAEFTSPPRMDVQEATGATRQPVAVKKVVTSSDDLGFIWEEMQEVDPNAGVDEFADLCGKLDRDMLEADAATLYAIRTSNEQGGLTLDQVKRIIDHVREIGGWQVGESFAGIDIAEAATRYIVKAGKEDDLNLYPTRGLGNKIIPYGMVDGKKVSRPAYDEGYATTVWQVCKLIRELTKLEEVPA